MDLIQHLKNQWAFSERTFGPARFKNHIGPIDHLRKELIEVESTPHDPLEWADIILLACDGAMRAGHSPEAICEALSTKLSINKSRKWPDWRNIAADKAIEHIRSDDAV